MRYDMSTAPGPGLPLSVTLTGVGGAGDPQCRHHGSIDET